MKFLRSDNFFARRLLFKLSSGAFYWTFVPESPVSLSQLKSSFDQFITFEREGNKMIYYMASSASGQDEPNRALRLATRAGKMEPSCPLGTTRCFPQAKFHQSHIINPLLTKFVRSRWLDIGVVLFLRVYGPRLRLGPQTRKKRTWPISSHLDLTLGQ